MMRRIWSSLSLRLIVAAVAGLVVVLSITGLALASIYRDAVFAAFDDRLVSLSRIIISTIELDRDGTLYLRRDIGEPLFENAYSGWYWEVGQQPDARSPTRMMLSSRSLFDAALKPPSQWSNNRAFTMGPNGEELRIVRARVTLPGSALPFEIWVAGDYAEVKHQIGNYAWTLAIALGLLAVGMVLAVIFQVQFALSPMRRVRIALGDIRQGKADRLEGEFPSEVEPLVKELNALLEHNQQVLDRARTEVGNLAHALKTPLSVLRNEVESGDPGLAETVRRETETMRRQVDHHLARARAAATANVLRARTVIEPRAAALVRAMRRIHQDRSIAFDLECPPSLAFRGEGEDLDEILGNLLDNAGKWADSRVAVAVSGAGRKIKVSVTDDGPGLSEAQARAVLTRGQRLDESVPGTGLGLSIVKDMVAIY
ncbi:MAG TPA: sensor histidine kinase, partial [Alphaproteobacteria bacterium]|nr:sensor histidine kinase [Alphaproteobacteria bacterium]